MTDTPYLSVVVPCYNEEQRLRPTLISIAAYLQSLDFESEIVVVDDGSQDQTVRVARQSGVPGLRICSLGENQGKGAAVAAGVRESRGEWVLFTDADNSTPIEELEKFLPRMKECRAEVLCGSRSLPDSQVVGRSSLRRLATRVLSEIVRLGLALPVRDSQCGFKAFRKPSALKILERQSLSGFAFDLELLYVAKKLNLVVEELAVRWFDAPGSKVQPFRELFRFLSSIYQVRRRHQSLQETPMKGAFA